MKTEKKLMEAQGKRLDWCLRVDMDLTIARAAKLLGLENPSTYSNYAYGVRAIPAAIWERIVILGYNANWIATGTGPRTIEGYAGIKKLNQKDESVERSPRKGRLPRLYSVKDNDQ